VEVKVNHNINDLFEDLLEGKNLSKVFEDYNFNAYLHTALNDINKDITGYIKSHRLDLYQNHYPYFFRSVVNHMLLQIKHNSFKQFEAFDIRSNFSFEVLKPEVKATMQSVSPFTYHPFQVQAVESLGNKLRININSGPILFNTNELLLWISPYLSQDNFLKTKNLLCQCYGVEMVVTMNGMTKRLDLIQRESVLYDQPFLMQAMLESVSPEMFGYQSFEVAELEKIENLQIEIEYITLFHHGEAELPDDIHALFMFNLMPVFSMLDDYAAHINIDGSKEYYPITASGTTNYKSFYMENEVLLDKVRLDKYISSKSETLNYIIKRKKNSNSHIKLQRKVGQVINKQLQVHATWTQLIDINQYQDKSIKILDRDKISYIPKVIYKKIYSSNLNDEKIDNFIELSNLINYRIFNVNTIKAICDISSLNQQSKLFLDNLISVNYLHDHKSLSLDFTDCSNIEKLKIIQGVNLLEKILGYLLNDNIDVEIIFSKSLIEM